MAISFSDSHYSNQQKPARLPCRLGIHILLDFLLKIIKEFTIEKLPETDF